MIYVNWHCIYTFKGLALAMLSNGKEDNNPMTEGVADRSLIFLN